MDADAGRRDQGQQSSGRRLARRGDVENLEHPYGELSDGDSRDRVPQEMAKYRSCLGRRGESMKKDLACGYCGCWLLRLVVRVSFVPQCGERRR